MKKYFFIITLILINFYSYSQISGLPTGALCAGSNLHLVDNTPISTFRSWTLTGASITNSNAGNISVNYASAGVQTITLFSGSSATVGQRFVRVVTIVGASALTPINLTYNNGVNSKVCLNTIGNLVPIVSTATGGFFTSLDPTFATYGFSTATGIFTFNANNRPSDNTYGVYYSYIRTLSGVNCLVNTALTSLWVESFSIFGYRTMASGVTPFGAFFPPGYNINQRFCNQQVLDLALTVSDPRKLDVIWQYATIAGLSNTITTAGWNNMPGTFPRWSGNDGVGSSGGTGKGYAIGYDITTTGTANRNTDNNDFKVAYGDPTYYFRAISSYKANSGGVCINIPSSPNYITHSIAGIATAGTVIGVNQSYGLNSTNSGTNVRVCSNDILNLSLSGFWGVAYWQRGTINTLSGVTSWLQEPVTDGQVPYIAFGTTYNSYDYYQNSTPTANPNIHVKDDSNDNLFDYRPSGNQNGIATYAPIITQPGTYLFRVGVTYNQTMMNDGRGPNASPGPCGTISSNIITVTSVACSLQADIQNLNTLNGLCLTNATLNGISLLPSTTITGDGIAFIKQYNWSFGAGSSPPILTTTSRVIPSFRYTTAGTKTVSLTVIGNNLLAIASTTINVSDLSKVNSNISSIASNTLCGGNVINLSLAGLNQLNNPNPYLPTITWYSSVSGVGLKSISGSNFATVTIPNTDVVYTAKVQNGFCPSTLTSNFIMKGLAPLNAIPMQDQTIVLCEGLSTVLGVTSNYGTEIAFGYTNDGTLASAGNFTNVSVFGTNLGSNLGLGVFQTRKFDVSGTHYYRADVSNAFSCTPTVSGIFTISVVSCPIVPTIISSAVGLAFSNRACLNNRGLFTIKDFTPTLPGVTFTIWKWNFQGGNPTQSDVTFTNATSFQNTFSIEDIVTVSLTVSGFAGNKPYVGMSQTTLTIDGISTIIGLSSNTSDNLFCLNAPVALSLRTPDQRSSIVEWKNITSNSILGTTLLTNAAVSDLHVLSLLGFAGAGTQTFQAKATNGICPSYTSSNLTITVVSPPNPSLSPSSFVSTVCKGQAATFSINGLNILKTNWQKEISPGTDIYISVAGISNNLFTTENLPTIGTYRYKAIIDGAYGCEANTTLTITVNSVNCDITPTITVSGASRFCYNSTNFNSNVVLFQAMVPTFSGVAGLMYNWDFGNDVNNNGVYPLFATTNSPDVLYNQNTALPTRNISLTVTGISGVSTLIGIAMYTITIDGMPTISGLAYFGGGGTLYYASDPGDGFCIPTGTSKAATNSDAISLSFGTDGVFYNPSSKLSLYFKKGNSSIEFANDLRADITSYLFTTTGGLTTTTSFLMTMQSGICPVYTTTSLIVPINTQPQILRFAYPNPGYCTNTTTVSPIISVVGSAFNLLFTADNSSSTSENNLSIDAVTGRINPSSSYGKSGGRLIDEFKVSFTIPSNGACSVVNTFTSLSIGQEIKNPSFSYGSSPYCSNAGLISPTFNAVSNQFFGIGYYVTTVNGISTQNFTTSGIVNVTNLTSPGTGNVYPIAFKVDEYAGCSAIKLDYLLTVTGLPSQPSFNFNRNYCSSVGVVTVNSPVNTNDPLGYWTMKTLDDFGNYIPASDFGVFINSTTGVFTMTGDAISEQYTVTYTKPPREGCLSEVSFDRPFFITRLNKPIPFAYNPSELCANSSKAILAPNVTLPGIANRDVGAFISLSNDLIVSPVSGSGFVSSNSVSGARLVQYVISSTGACAGNIIVSNAQINFIATPAPSFGYASLITCNQGNSRILYPTNLMDIDTISPKGYFYLESGSLNLNSITGAIQIDNSTTEDLYTIQYIIPNYSLCGTSFSIKANNDKSLSLYIENAPTNPNFVYQNSVICSKFPQQPTISVTNQKNLSFFAPRAIPINSTDGTIFLDRAPEGIYVMTCTNQSFPININGVLTTTCPIGIAYASITVSSTVNIPPFGYGRSSFCSDEGVISLVGTNLPTGGNYNIPFGDSWLNSVTGVIDLSKVPFTSSNQNDYTIAYTVSRENCTPISSTIGINISKASVPPSLSYSKPEFCSTSTENNPFPILGSTTNVGKFFSSTGLEINSITGLVNLNNSLQGGYQIEYLIDGVGRCSAVKSTTNMFVRKQVEIKFSYARDSYCQSKNIVAPKEAFPEGGTFISSIGLSVDGLGNINTGQSKIGVGYVIYSVTGIGECPSQSSLALITITSPFSSQTFDFSPTPYCNAGTTTPVLTPVNFDYSLGYFTADRGIVLTDSIRGTIDLKRSVPLNDGTKYRVFYNVFGNNDCDGYTVTKEISIRTGKIGFISSEDENSFTCQNSKGVVVNLTKGNVGTLSWQQQFQTDPRWFPADGVLSADSLQLKTEPLKDTTYFRVRAIYNNCPDSVYSNTIKIRVIPASKGGIAAGTDGVLDSINICNKYTVRIGLRDYVGKIRWQFYEEENGVKPNSFTVWNDLDANQDTSYLNTASQNQYGNRRWFRAKVTSSFCTPDYSNKVLIQVCDNITFVPSAFTPNSNNDNSYWDLTKMNLRDDAIINVYNRYGTSVYSATGKDVQVISGCWDGGGLPMGAYYFVIDKRDQSKPLVGSVSIVR
jgi:gliding motility-associated-like protein